MMSRCIDDSLTLRVLVLNTLNTVSIYIFTVNWVTPVGIILSLLDLGHKVFLKPNEMHENIENSDIFVISIFTLY